AGSDASSAAGRGPRAATRRTRATQFHSDKTPSPACGPRRPDGRPSATIWPRPPSFYGAGGTSIQIDAECEALAGEGVLPRAFIPARPEVLGRLLTDGGNSMLHTFFRRPPRRDEQDRHRGVADRERPGGGELQRGVAERELVGVHQSGGGEQRGHG